MFLNNRRNVNHRSIGNKDENERPMRIISFPKQHLRDHIDLRRWMTPVEYQQDMNTWLDFKKSFQINFFLSFFLSFV